MSTGAWTAWISFHSSFQLAAVRWTFLFGLPSIAWGLPFHAQALQVMEADPLPTAGVSVKPCVYHTAWSQRLAHWMPGTEAEPKRRPLDFCWNHLEGDASRTELRGVWPTFTCSNSLLPRYPPRRKPTKSAERNSIPVTSVGSQV